MKILFITNRIPHAGITGGHQIIYQRIKRLAERGHQIGVAAFRAGESPENIEDLRQYTSELEMVDTKPMRCLGWNWCNSIFSHGPPCFAAEMSQQMARRVGDMVQRSLYDVAIAEFSEMGRYLYHNTYLPAVRRVLSCHRSIVASANQTRPPMETARLASSKWSHSDRPKRCECDIFRVMDGILTLTPEDRYWLLNYLPEMRIYVVPAGVDPEYFKPAAKEEKEPCLMFMGSYRDVSNEDAVLWFIRDVWPLLKERCPAIKFLVVGPDPTKAMRELAARDGNIEIAGWVDDVRSYLARAQVFVCPIRLGTGMRSKVIEAMAAGLPVVSTTLAMEGIPAQNGETALLADQPQIMADSVMLLLNDEYLRQKITQQARTMVLERFSWNNSITKLENILHDIVRV